jgi:hypothetical protein
MRVQGRILSNTHSLTSRTRRADGKAGYNSMSSGLTERHSSWSSQMAAG